MMTSAVIAQTTPPPPCKALETRTITYCYPIDNSTGVSGIAVTDYGWIKDSLPHTSKDVSTGSLYGSPDIFNGGGGFNWDDKIHTYNIVVTDSMGTFQNRVCSGSRCSCRARHRYRSFHCVLQTREQ